MEIKEQNENRIVLQTDLIFYVFKPEYFLSAFAWIIIGILIFYPMPDMISFLPPWWMVMIVVIVVWAIASGETIFDCTFDKRSETIFAKTRAPWRMGIPLSKKISFHDVKGLLLFASERGKSTLQLQLKSTTYPFVSGGTAQLAEDICDFLGVPLIIDMGSERVTRIPFKATAEDVGITATPCPKCGAPLPRIYPALQNVKCAHCGMTLLLEWNEKLTSFRTKIAN